MSTTLTNEQMNKFQKHLRKGNCNTVCPVCGNDNWGVNFVIAAPKFSAGNVSFDQTLPMLPLTCTSCGYVWLFAAFTVLGKDGV